MSKADDALNRLEFTVDDFLNSLREDIEKNGFKSKHKRLIDELKYVVGGARTRLLGVGKLDW
jgi:hypothetical protein